MAGTPPCPRPAPPPGRLPSRHPARRWVYWVHGRFLIRVEASIVRFLLSPKLRPYNSKKPGLRSLSGRFTCPETVVRGGSNRRPSAFHEVYLTEHIQTGTPSGKPRRLPWSGAGKPIRHKAVEAHMLFGRFAGKTAVHF
jgi:hypothetical protein